MDQEDRPTIDNMPDEVLVEIFSFLSPKLLKVSALVCNRFEKIILFSIPNHFSSPILQMEQLDRQNPRTDETLQIEPDPWQHVAASRRSGSHSEVLQHQIELLEWNV